MTRFVYIFLFCILCCCNKKKESNKQTAPILDNSLKFENIRNAAYAFSFSRPTTFREQIDTIGQVDSIVFNSKNKEAKLIYFVEGEISVHDASENHLYKYFKNLKFGNQNRLRNCKILKSRFNYVNDYSNYRGYFLASGEKDKNLFIWKTELSEIPISGDLTYKTMLFIYPKQKKGYYEPIGMELSKRFGNTMNK